MEDLNNVLIGATLHSFRNAQQFLEIELSSDTYEEIIFFIDCRISCSDDKISEIVKHLYEVEPDVSEIAFFIPANNKKILEATRSDRKIELVFEGEYKLVFHLENEYGEPLSISFKKKKNDTEYDSIAITL